MSPVLTGSGRRETRLLVVTIAVSTVLLIVLARFRFPDAQRPVSPAPSTLPLERLAARATYDELAGIMANVERQVEPFMLVLDVQAAEGAVASRDEPGTRAVPALRIRDGMALVALEPGERVVGVRGTPGAAVELVARNDLQGLAVVQVPVATARTLSVAADPRADAPPRYVAAVEASRGGPSVRPLFLSRLDPVNDPRWERPLMSLGGALTAQPGSFVFSFDGQLIGFVVADGGLPALVPASQLLASASQLADGRSRRRGELGIVWQRLTPALAAATGARTGVLVSGVTGDGPAESVLQPGDVVQTIDGRAIRSPADARQAVAAIEPGRTAALDIVRGPDAMQVTLVATDPTALPPPGGATDPGVVLRQTRQGLEVVRTSPGDAAELAGLRAGDVITQIDRQPVSRTSEFTRRWADAAPDEALLLTVLRDRSTVILALSKP